MEPLQKRKRKANSSIGPPPPLPFLIQRNINMLKLKHQELFSLDQFARATPSLSRTQPADRHIAQILFPMANRSGNVSPPHPAPSAYLQWICSFLQQLFISHGSSQDSLSRCRLLLIYVWDEPAVSSPLLVSSFNRIESITCQERHKHLSRWVMFL